MKPIRWSDGVEHPLPWRCGRSVLRTIYDANEVLIGMMDTAELATQVVVSVNLAKMGPTIAEIKKLVDDAEGEQ